MFDLTARAFNLSERYRVPVFVMADADVGHLTERVVIPAPEGIEIVNRKAPTGPREEYQTFRPDADLVPPMARAGEGYHVFMESLTHDERGYPTMTGEAHNRLVRRLSQKIRDYVDDIIDYEERHLDDAEVAIVSYGISARIASRAVEVCRESGMRVGMLRLITAWPFPEDRVRRLASQVRGIVVPELNLGQMSLEVERCAAGAAPVVLLPHAGGGLHEPDDTVSAVEGLLR
jgi:2-oxoglutarate ferredoxin oxidoreductase subunit alpha